MAIAAGREALGDELVAELAALPDQALRDGARFCYGSPVSDVQSFLPEPADDEGELLAGVGGARWYSATPTFRSRAAPAAA